MKVEYKLSKYIEIILVISMLLYITSTVLMQSISSIFEFAFWGTIFILFLMYIIKSIKNLKKIEKIQKLFITYYIYIIISAIKLDNFKLLAHGIYEYIFYTMSFFAVIYIYEHKKFETHKIAKYSYVFIIMTNLLAVLGVFELLRRKLLLEGQAHYFDTSSLLYVRSQVFSGSPLIFGTLMGCFSICFFFFYLKTHQNLFLFSTTLSFAAIVTSGSRGPLIATLFGYGICLGSKYISKYSNNISVLKAKFKYVLITLGIILICLYLGRSYSGSNPILMKLFSVFNWKTDIGNVGRLETWSKYFKIFKENWLFGTGIATTGSVTLNIPGNIGVTESSLLKLLVELGIVGFLCYITIIISVFKKGLENYKYISESNKGILILCVAIVSAILVECLVLQITEIFNVSIILWLCLGLIYSIANNAVKSNS